MKVIVLTAEQAAALPRQGEGRNRLQPMPRTDGTFELPADILESEKFDAQREFLAALPQAAADVTKLRWYADQQARPAAAPRAGGR